MKLQMNKPFNASSLNNLRLTVKTLSLLVLALGLVEMAGWIFNLPALRNLLPQTVPMKFNTAVGLAGAGSALLLLQSGEKQSYQKSAGRALAILISGMGLVTLSEYLLGWNLHLDQFFLRDLISHSLYPGRMSVVTAVCFVLSGLCLFFLNTKPTQYFALGIITVSLLAVIVYLFNYETFYRLPGYNSATTAFAFLVFSLAVILSSPTLGVMRLFTSNRKAGQVLRLLTPSVILLIIALGLLIEEGERVGLINPLFESDFLVVILILIFCPFIYLYGKNMYKAEEEIFRLNRLYATRSQLNQMIVRVHDHDELYQAICDIAVKYGLFAMAWIYLLDETSGFVKPLTRSGTEMLQWPFPGFNLTQSDRQHGVLGLALRKSRVATSEDLRTSQNSLVLHDELIKRSYNSIAAVPFRQADRLAGVLILVAHESGFFKAAEEISLLDEMGQDISYALDRMQAEVARQQAETDLKEARELFQRVFDHNPVATVLSRGSERIIVDVNLATENLFGYPREELLGRPSTDFDYWSDPRERQRALEIFPSTGKIINFEFSFKTKTNMLGHALLFIESIELQNEKYFLSSFIDVTARQQAEESFSKAFMSNPAALMITRMSDGKFIESNEAYSVIVGFERNELIGHYSTEFSIYTHPDQRNEILAHLQAKGSLHNYQAEIQHKSGALRTVLASLELITFNREPCVLSTLIDITQLKQAEAELRTLNAQLEQRVAERTMELTHANRAKDDFLASMSHELRTPLNTILGLSETLLEQRRGILNEKQIHSMNLIYTSGQHLLGLITDILDVSKIEAGKLQIQPEVVLIRELCESSLNFIKELALKKSIQVEYSNPENIATLWADPRRFKQILVNLLSNAVKFTPEKGCVTLEVKLNPTRDQLDITVADTGIGIAADQLTKIFTPFTQLDSSLARQYAGTGLGLVLVARFTELHGGHVHVESKLGHGSRFTVSVPWQENPLAQTASERTTETTASYTEPTPDSQPALVLLADDNETNILMLTEYLQEHGYRVLKAHTGSDALEKVQEVLPDIILMDIQMPGMDGLEAIERLRRLPPLAATPIIALTALAMPGDRERCLAAGANDYLSKPIQMKSLLNKMAEYLHNDHQTST